MATIVICDGCGKVLYFDESCKPPIDHPTDYSKTDPIVDLCPDCYKEFENSKKLRVSIIARENNVNEDEEDINITNMFVKTE